MSTKLQSRWITKAESSQMFNAFGVSSHHRATLSYTRGRFPNGNLPLLFSKYSYPFHAACLFFIVRCFEKTFFLQKWGLGNCMRLISDQQANNEKSGQASLFTQKCRKTAKTPSLNISDLQSFFIFYQKYCQKNLVEPRKSSTFATAFENDAW